MKTRRNLTCCLAIMVLALIFAGCKKPENPSNGGDDNGGGTNLVEDTIPYVDLGLPSGTLWATYNVGATTPEDYGNYFAWGETTIKGVYNSSTYKYSKKDGEWYYLTKYCSKAEAGYDGFTDTLTILEACDDAATANWGANWHTPTAEDWREMVSNTTSTWTEQKGVVGRRFTASNGNSIFLPAAGSCYENWVNYDGSHGNYWSSSLITSNPGTANGFIIGLASAYLDINGRANGYSVRPVRPSL